MPEDVTGAELGKEILAEVQGLGGTLGREVARRLVMVGMLMDEDPDQAWAHAQVARRMAGRSAAVREAAGLAAYGAGHFAEALSELRTARRLTGSQAHLPLMADCERGLGRPERALELAASSEARSLDLAGRVEMLLVAAGARTDLGQIDTAAVMLKVPELNHTAAAPWLARLRAAYAEVLLALGREEEARTWLERAVAVDEDGVSGADERLAEMDGVLLLDLDEIADTEDRRPGDGGQPASPGETPSATGGDRPQVPEGPSGAHGAGAADGGAPGVLADPPSEGGDGGSGNSAAPEDPDPAVATP